MKTPSDGKVPPTMIAPMKPKSSHGQSFLLKPHKRVLRGGYNHGQANGTIENILNERKKKHKGLRNNKKRSERATYGIWYQVW